MAFERPVLANPDPRHQAFVDLSCHLLEEMEADFLTTTGRAFDGHAAVFLGIEVLVGLVDETSWAGSEPWKLELGYQALHQPDPDQVLAFMVHLSAFVVFLGKSVAADRLGVARPRTRAVGRSRATARRPASRAAGVGHRVDADPTRAHGGDPRAVG